MLATNRASLDDVIVELSCAIASLRRAAAHASGAAREDALCAALRASDELTATAVGALARRGPLEAGSGLTAEMLLALEGRRTGSEARMFVQAASTLSAMTETAAAFSRGDLSWGQVRAIVSALKVCDAPTRERIDVVIGAHAPRLRAADPDELVRLVDDEVSRARQDLMAAREDRQIERGFLAIQGRFDGSASFYGEGDGESIATMVEALDAACSKPPNPDDATAPTRAQQRFDAMIHICEASLSRAAPKGTRPRPRVLATLEVRDLAEQAEHQGARLLWGLAGRPPRLTRLATETLLCDARVIPVLFDGTHPVAIGRETERISSRMRTALIARDRGCRFPGCRAPATWTDAHHIVYRSRGGRTRIEDLVLLCRRCHRRIHRHRWRIAIAPDGTISFTGRGRAYTSSPRAGPVLRE